MCLVIVVIYVNVKNMDLYNDLMNLSKPFERKILVVGANDGRIKANSSKKTSTSRKGDKLQNDDSYAQKYVEQEEKLAMVRITACTNYLLVGCHLIMIGIEYVMCL